MQLIDILSAAVRVGANDIHLASGSVPLVRVAGTILELRGFEALTTESCKQLIYSSLYEEQRAKFEQHRELDCALHVPQVGHFRLNVLRQRGVVEAVLRVIPATIPSPEVLGLGPVAMGLADLPRGLVLVTGPAGSGKTSTLACMLEYINRNYRKHIITIEDPIEYVFTRKQSVLRQREVGPDTDSFQSALRYALRQDPDVICVGELRDLESISMALTAAETGHLCFSTLHTNSASQTVDRIIDVFPPHHQQQVRVQLAGALKGVISQLLLARADGRGLIAAREIMVVTPAIANLIREGKTHMIPNTIETGGKLGMFTMDKSLEEMARRGLISLQEALAKSYDLSRLQDSEAAGPAGQARPDRLAVSS